MDDIYFLAKILIVDDSPESIDVLLSSLPKQYRRQIALSGEKALHLLVTSDDLPDLILLDVMMPGMDGYEVCRRIKEDKRLRDIPVIFLSAYSDLQNKVQAFSSGGVDYITKPFDYEEVQARVNTHLQLHRLHNRLEEYNKELENLVQEQVKEISELQMATIYALANLAESRDHTTGKHLERTQTTCRLLAEKLGEQPKYKKIINANFIEQLFRASPLHDIGKVGVSDAILLKPGKLTSLEFEVIKRHTLIGARTLLEVQKKYPGNNFISTGIDIARSHHERWDGSGYPDGLAGDQIPLSARIMAIADVYDALRSIRPYKEAFNHRISVDTIEGGKGKHFDPMLIDAFSAIEYSLEGIYYKMGVDVV